MGLRAAMLEDGGGGEGLKLMGAIARRRLSIWFSCCHLIFSLFGARNFTFISFFILFLNAVIGSPLFLYLVF